MKYVKQFDEHDDYVLYKEENDIMNVSKCDTERHIHYSTAQLKEMPLTFRILSDGVIKWTVSDVENAKTIQYSKDNGEWTDITATVEGTEIPVEIGDVVQFKGTNDAYTNASTQFNNFKNTTCVYEVLGNIMSMIYGDNFKNATEFPAESSLNFFNFFRATRVKTARHLILPLTTLVPNCYASMFYGCTDLMNTPNLPATTLANGCYQQMFRNCISITKTVDKLPALDAPGGAYYYMYSNTSITKAPEIMATTIGTSTCERMFNGCVKLTQVQDSFYATTLGESSYNCMFIGCEALTTAPYLPATVVPKTAYDHMFAQCLSLINVPDLPAITVGEEGCNCMFIRCESLVNAPEIAVMNMEKSSLAGMFYHCVSLVNPPSVLPALTLTELCYEAMFYECESLVTAPAISATVTAINCCEHMFNYCSNLTTPPPVLAAPIVADYAYWRMLCNCPKLTSCPRMPIQQVGIESCRSMFQESGIVTAPDLPATTLGNKCYQYMFYNCKSLTTGPSNLPATTLAASCYSFMFCGCTLLSSIPSVLPATTLADSCYNRMFQGTAITTAPDIKAETLANGCCYLMFEGCKNITQTPILRATTLVNNCYNAMFQNCSNLNTITCLATDISASGALTNWVRNVSSTGTFIKDSTVTNWPTGNSGIPNNWTVQDAS